jgi:hypothetical protein
MLNYSHWRYILPQHQLLHQLFIVKQTPEECMLGTKFGDVTLVEKQAFVT